MGKIEKAAVATDDVQRRVGDVIDGLERAFNGSIINGFGVYSDPGLQRAELRSALNLLARAMEIMDGTDWPAPHEFERH